jgi:Leucine-rich repeat (LRR) protein
LSVLNLEGCNNLKKLHVRRIALTELDIPNPAAIEYLICGETQIAFNWNEFTGLISLEIPSMDLTSMDFIPEQVKAKLQQLVCSDNKLEFLDLSQYPELRVLICDYNKIQHLDVSVVPALQHLSCYRNYIQTLDISTLANLKNIYCGNQYNNINLILTLTDEQKVLWKDVWNKNNSNNNRNVYFYDDTVDDGESSGNGFGNGGKF